MLLNLLVCVFFTTCCMFICFTSFVATSSTVYILYNQFTIVLICFALFSCLSLLLLCFFSLLFTVCQKWLHLCSKTVAVTKRMAQDAFFIWHQQLCNCPAPVSSYTSVLPRWVAVIQAPPPIGEALFPHLISGLLREGAGILRMVRSF